MKTSTINSQAFATLMSRGNIKGLQLLRKGRTERVAICRISGTSTKVLITTTGR